MKKTYTGFAGLSLLLLLGTQTVQAQQGFGTDKPAKSAAVDIQSSKRGLLIPRVDLKSTVDAKTIDSPAQSLMVYNQATTKVGTNDVTPGYYYWDTDRWVRFAKQSEITEITLKGDVTGPTNATIVGKIQGVEVSGNTPTANQVLTYVPGTEGKKGQWTPTTITSSLISEGKNVNAGSTKVSLSEGAKGASLKEYTVDIVEEHILLEKLGGQLPVNKLVKGEDGQVLITKGGVSTWVKQAELVPTTSNTLTKKSENGTVDVNTIVSTVNGKLAEVKVIDNVVNSLEDNKLVTTVNGKAGEGIDLTPVIQAGQKVTTVVDGMNTTVSSTVNPAGSNTTEYKVNVSNDDIQAAQKVTTVSQGNGVKVTPADKGNNTTDYNVAINTDGSKVGDVLTVVKDGDTTNKVEWKKPEEFENIYTHDGTLINATDEKKQRKVSFGNFYSLFFNKAGEGHDFTFDDNGHTGLNMYGNVTSSIGLIARGNSNGRQSKLQLKHVNGMSEINANSDKGLRITAGFQKGITFGTFYVPEGKTNDEFIDHVVIKGDGGVQVTNINKPEFTGKSTDKIVVADEKGVLKTVGAAMPKVFYMPPVMFDTSKQGTGKTRNLYNEYKAMFTGDLSVDIIDMPKGTDKPARPALVKNDEAEKATIPVIGVKELDFYVAYYDPTVFAKVKVDNNGVLSYDIIKKAKYGAFMTVVFVVRDNARK